MAQQAHLTHLASSPFVSPFSNIHAFEEQRQAERQTHLDSRRSGRRFPPHTNQPGQ